MSTMVSLMRAFVNDFVLRRFGPLSAFLVTRLRLTIYRGLHLALNLAWPLKPFEC
jgi:hypothetical protein